MKKITTLMLALVLAAVCAGCTVRAEEDFTPPEITGAGLELTPPAPEPRPGMEFSGETLAVDGISIPVWERDGERYVDAPALESALGGSANMEAVSVEGAEYLPYPEAVEGIDCPRLYDGETGTLYLTPSAAVGEIPEGVDVPVMIYHAVSDDVWGIEELFTSPARIEEQIRYLTENGYETVWFSDLDHAGDYEKPVIITLDDGYEDNYTELFPILKKYNVKATIFVIAGLVGTPRYMTAAQLRELADSGLVSVQSHTYSHEFLDGMGPEELRFEMEASRLVLARCTGRVPYVISYPAGRSDALARAAALGSYHFGINSLGGHYNTSDDRYQVKRCPVNRDTTIEEYAAIVSGDK